jgi:hypothetical protein
MNMLMMMRLQTSEWAVLLLRDPSEVSEEKGKGTIYHLLVLLSPKTTFLPPTLVLAWL